tara:strand:- start:691 stop:1560 length:870 start_codon:yes stop_codon:yes gene_type:complete
MIKEKTSLSTGLFDQTFKEDNPELYWIFQISDSDISYTLIDTSSNTFIGLQECSWDNKLVHHAEPEKYLSKVLSNLAFLPNSNQKSLFSINNDLYTIIPKSLFEKDQLENYLKLNFSAEKLENTIPHAQLVESIQAYIVYAIPTYLLKTIQQKFDHLKFSHHATSLIEMNLLRHSKKTMISINLKDGAFDIYCQNEGHFIYMNSFSYTSPEDVAYYLLYVMEQLELDRNSINISLYGQIEVNSQVYELLFTYLKNVHLGDRIHQMNYSPVLQKIPAHHHYNLFSQYLCV